MKDSFVPLYYRIAKELRARILSGELKPGDPLPSENESAAAYSTTRVTVDRGFKLLEKEGLIETHSGKGYFVTNPNYNTFILKVDTGGDLTSKYGKVTVIDADEDVAAFLEMHEPGRVVLVTRVISNDGKVVAYEEKFLPYRKGVPLLEEEIRYADLPEIAASKLSPFSVRSDIFIGAIACDERLSKVLSCEMGTPLLEYRLISKDDEGRVFGYARTFLSQGFGFLQATSYILPSER